jgi:WhiB family redox-sensing transcriptional regulator
VSPAPGWRGRAACGGSNPALFYDLHPAAIDAAKAVCVGCPVRDACAAHALGVGEEFGVWGGLAADDRPTPSPTTAPTPGPSPRISDDELYDLLVEADPDRSALDQLLEHVWLPAATACTTLERAVRLGVAERRGRALFPLRRCPARARPARRPGARASRAPEQGV